MGIARAAVHAVLSLPDEQRLLYSVLIERALSEAARKALAMESQIEKFFTQAHRESFDRGKAEGLEAGKAEGREAGKAEGREAGKAEGLAAGKAEALLLIVKRRGMKLADSQQEQILRCTSSATLDRWLDRALSVTSVDELLG